MEFKSGILYIWKQIINYFNQSSIMATKSHKYTVFLEDGQQYTFQQIKEFLSDKYSVEDTKKNQLCILFDGWKLNLEFNSKKTVSRESSILSNDFGKDGLSNCSCALDITPDSPPSDKNIEQMLALLERMHNALAGIHIFDSTDLYFLWNNVWMPEPGENWLDIDLDFMVPIPGNRALNQKISKAAVNPNSAGNWNNLGIEYYNLKDYVRALPAFVNTTIIDERYHWGFYNAGLCYAYLDRNEEAEQAYKKCLEISPTYLNAINNLAKLYIKLDQKELGIQYFEQAATIDQNNSSAFTSLGFYLLLFGEPEKALININKAMNLGDHSFSNLNKGHYHLIKGERDKAIACYKASRAAFNNDENFWNDYNSDYEIMPVYNISKEDYEALKILI